MKNNYLIVKTIFFCLILIMFSSSAVFAANEATEHTKAANAAWYDMLDFGDEAEKENALRGLIEAPESVVIYRDDGVIAWNVDAFDFVRDTKAPDTVNPSLWRNTQLNAYAGLFEVTEGTTVQIRRKQNRPELLVRKLALFLFLRGRLFIGLPGFPGLRFCWIRLDFFLGLLFRLRFYRPWHGWFYLEGLCL